MAKYLKDMETLGLTDENDGEYTIKFYVDDQGYSKVERSLKEMNRNAKILLGLSSALLAVTMILTAFLFSRQHKHSAGILRMLGGSKKQAFTAILACAAAVVAAGGVVGTILGGALTQSVGASILGDVKSAAVELATGANAALTALSGLGCMALFLLLTAIFTATYIGKEPRALLPQDKG
jgi:ABC-type antimicrobial peptide transport system permease subunit